MIGALEAMLAGMRWTPARLLVLGLIVLVTGCANRVTEASSRGISIAKQDLGDDPQIAADAHCAKYGRTAELYAVEPTSYVGAIYHYHCN